MINILENSCEELIYIGQVIEIKVTRGCLESLGVQNPANLGKVFYLSLPYHDLQRKGSSKYFGSPKRDNSDNFHSSREY